MLDSLHYPVYIKVLIEVIKRWRWAF